MIDLEMVPNGQDLVIIDVKNNLIHPTPRLYLVAHPTNRKWVTTLVIDGISGGNIYL